MKGKKGKKGKLSRRRFYALIWYLTFADGYESVFNENWSWHDHDYFKVIKDNRSWYDHEYLGDVSAGIEHTDLYHMLNDYIPDRDAVLAAFSGLTMTGKIEDRDTRDDIRFLSEAHGKLVRCTVNAEGTTEALDRTMENDAWDGEWYILKSRDLVEKNEKNEKNEKKGEKAI